MGVKFSFAKIFVFCVKLCLLQSILLRFFLLNKTFLQFFLFTNCAIVFCDLSLSGLLNLWQASICWLSTEAPISAKTDISDSSKTSSETDSGIPLKTMLFRRPYCAKALWSDSYFEHCFSNHSHLCLNFSFSSCRFLMAISLRLMISSLRELIRLTDLLCPTCSSFGLGYSWLALAFFLLYSNHGPYFNQMWQKLLPIATFILYNFIYRLKRRVVHAQGNP